MSRWAAVPVPLPLFLLGHLSLWVLSAFLAVVKATSCRVHSAWSVDRQANGAPIPQPAQVINLNVLKSSEKMKAVVHHKNLIICGNNIILSSSCPTALICPVLKAPEHGQMNCSHLQLRVHLFMRSRICVTWTWPAGLQSPRQLDGREAHLPR